MSRVSGVAELVRLQILRGRIRPGERVNEVLLVEQLRTRRASLREALRLLEGRGLLVATESGGMQVIEVDGDGLAEALEVRAALEALSAGLAAGRSRRGQLSAGALRSASQLADAPADDRRPAAALFADRRFHLAVDALAGNRPGHVALDHLWDRIMVGGLCSGSWPLSDATAAHDHRELLLAIASGDADHASAIAYRHAVVTAPGPASEAPEPFQVRQPARVTPPGGAAAAADRAATPASHGGAGAGADGSRAHRRTP